MQPRVLYFTGLLFDDEHVVSDSNRRSITLPICSLVRRLVELVDILTGKADLGVVGDSSNHL
jgi:hypothetical protein